VIGVQKDGHLTTDLKPDHLLEEGSTLVALGSPEQLGRFDEVYG
jgi:K+/H+ antiporter YhaU regulatory subunit KhtT